MAWIVAFDQAAIRELDKLVRQHTRKILTCPAERIAISEEPRCFGAPLRADLSGLWKYRIGDYRVVCDIQEEKILARVLCIGHRQEFNGIGHSVAK
ncbi:MAG: type II toxin-antitoxin system RelE family toxin [Desulfobulbaceae bacterium]